MVPHAISGRRQGDASPRDSFQPLYSESEAEEPVAPKGTCSLVLSTMELPFTLARHL